MNARIVVTEVGGMFRQLFNNLQERRRKPVDSVWYASVISATYNSKLGSMIRDQNSSIMFILVILLYVINKTSYRIKHVPSIVTFLLPRNRVNMVTF